MPNDIEGVAAEPRRVAYGHKLTTFVVHFLRDWVSVLLVWVILVPVTFWPSYKNGPPIRSDGLAYHAWTRAILERDLRVFCNWPGLGDSLSVTWRDPARGTCLNKFPPGLALLRFPVMAPLVDRRPNAPRISPAEHQASLILGAIALVLICILALSVSRRFGASSWCAHIAVLTTVFGTGLFHYATYDSSFTHIYSALGFAILIWLWSRSLQLHHKLPGVAIGLTAFFLVLIRSTNLLGLLLFAAAHLLVWYDFDLRSACLDVRNIILGVVPALLIEMGYAGYVTRTLTFSGYVNEHFVFNHPMQLSVLFSYERGLVTYYPVVALALLAGLLRRRTRAATLLVCALIAVYVILYGFWDSWMLGSGFGHRGFVDFMPFVIPVFAVALSNMRSLTRYIFVGAAFTSTVVTIKLMIGYWYLTLPFAGVTRSVYWSNVLGRYPLVHILPH